MDMAKLPKVAVGTWAWGNDTTFGEDLSESELDAVFETAMKDGLNLFDTAYIYGMGNSEKALASYLKTVPRDSYVISDKFTPRIADPKAENAVIEMFEGSCKRLGVDYIDIYWIHHPIEEPKWVYEIIPLAKSGRIGAIGLSNHDLAQVKQAQEILEKEGLSVAALQNHFSLLYQPQDILDLLEYSKEKAIPFFSYMVLEQGALTGKYGTANPFPADSKRGREYNPHLAAFDRMNAGLKKIADAHGMDIAQLVIAWAIARGTLPIVGATHAHDIDDAKKATGIELTAAELDQMNALASELKGLDLTRNWEIPMKEDEKQPV